MELRYAGGMSTTVQTKLPTEVIAQLCRKNQVSELSIFGSALRPDFGDHSDIDLLVTFQPQAQIGLIGFLRFQRELSEALGRKVDLVPKNGLKPLIRDEILTQAQVLYAV